MMKLPRIELDTGAFLSSALITAFAGRKGKPETKVARCAKATWPKEKRLGMAKYKN